MEDRAPKAGQFLKHRRYAGRFPSGVKYIAYNPTTRMYLHESCTRATPDRYSAWTGNLTQSRNIMELIPLATEFTIYVDGREKDDF